MSRSVPICVVGVPDGALDRSPLAGGRSLNPRPVDADTARPGRSHSPTSTGSPGSAYRADLRAGRVSCACSMMMTPLHSRWRAVERPIVLLPMVDGVLAAASGSAHTAEVAGSGSARTSSEYGKRVAVGVVRVGVRIIKKKKKKT